MPHYLEPVVQEFVAEAEKYIRPVKDMEGAAGRAKAANDLLVESIQKLRNEAPYIAVALRAIAGEIRDLRGEAATTATAARGLKDSLQGVATWAGSASRALGSAARQASSLGRGLAGADIAGDRLGQRMATLALSRIPVLMAGLVALDDELDKKKAALGATTFDVAALGLTMGSLSRSVRDLGAQQARMDKAMGAAGGTLKDTGNQARVAAGRFRLTGNAIHWLVMGTLEVAATAVPALVAFGAAAAGMSQAFQGIYQNQSNLITASGGLAEALNRSVGPLHQLGQGFGKLSKDMAPAAYVIFGSVINDIAGKTGLFAGMAQKAGSALAAFASKLTQDLNGPLGNQLAGFFKDSVKFMIQWGQVLGNLGHTFLNITTSMWGTAQLLLDVLVGLSRALQAVTANPIGAWLIGLAAAMSALYRYGKLAVTIWNWLGGSALARAGKAVIKFGQEWLIAAGDVGIGSATMESASILLDAALGPVGIAILAVTAALGYFWLSTQQAGQSTKDFIAKVQSAPPTLTNLAAGLIRLKQHVAALGQQAKATKPGIMSFIAGLFGAQGTFSAFEQAGNNINATNKAIRQQVQELVNLHTGLSQTGLQAGAVGAAMQAMSIQSGLASSKIDQVNQALDQFMQNVTGGASGVAGFAQSIANIGQVAGHVANNLGQAQNMSLNVTQFAGALKSGMVKGSGAWTNFTQILGSTMPQVMDWFRTAMTEGAATGKTVSKAALDMAAAMVPFAAKSKVARSMLLGFLQAQGLNIHTFPQLLAAIKANHAGLADLSKITGDATVAMSNLTKIAQNMSDVLSGQATQAISKVALKASGFDAATNQLSRDLQKYGANSPQVARDTQTVTNAFDRAQRMAGKIAQQARLAQQAIDQMHGKNIVIGIHTIHSSTGVVSGGGGSTSGGGKDGGGGGGAHVHVHVHGSSMATHQQIGQAVQTALNQKTIRNGSTQLYITGRRH